MISPALQKLINTPQKKNGAHRKNTIKVDTRLAEYIEKYERLRNIIGFHDEHAWRRYAIERIIKRHIYLSLKHKPDASSLLQELVMAHYIDEEDMSGDAVHAVSRIIDKYLVALELIAGKGGAPKKEVEDWFFRIMSIEIEDELDLIDHEIALVDAMSERLKSQLQFPEYYLTKEQEDLFVLIASCRTLIKADPEFIAYFLIKRWYPDWISNNSAVEQRVAYIWSLKQHLAEYENHPVFSHVLKLAKKHVVIFWILDELIHKFKGDLTDLKKKTHFVVQEMSYQLQSKVKRQIWRAFLYLLITKFSLVLILELPYELWKFGHLQILQALINLGTPIFLLVSLTVGVRVSTRANTEKIISEVARVVEQKPTELQQKIGMVHGRSLAKDTLFHMLFFFMYVLVFGGIILMLYELDFNLVSGWLFVTFLTLVSYMGMKIRVTAERLRIVRPATSVGREVVYFFALPILSSGQWIATRFTRYNFIIMIFDLFFEAPYKTLIFVFRDFSDFARERREKFE